MTVSELRNLIFERINLLVVILRLISNQDHRDGKKKRKCVVKML